MRFRADEKLHADIVNWLRACGHDVLYVAETHQQEGDGTLLALAESQSRVVLTDDKDFGELVFRPGRTMHGVILLRLPSLDAVIRVSRSQDVWDLIVANLPGNFVVVSADRVRIRKPVV